MLLFFVLFSFALSKRAEVYGIFTDFGPGLKRTIVQLGSVDVSSGNVTQLQSLFVYEGSSGTFDGISAFDRKVSSSSSSSSSSLFSSHFSQRTLVCFTLLMTLPIHTCSACLFVLHIPLLLRFGWKTMRSGV